MGARADRVVVGGALLVLPFVAACRKESSPEQRVPTSAAGSAVGSAVGSAAGSAVGVDAASPQAVPAGPVDLLHATTVTVAVSSVVANPAISPFDLVDGDSSTAWNSRTGDTKAWIAFRVPPSTHVDRVRMTVGFTAKGPEGDYFTMNQRIRKVRVWHDGVSLREVTLDVERRDLQDIAVDANGGDYKLEVTATVPGTKKTWREVAVSDLQVIGTPPPGASLGEDLTLAVGSLDATPLADPSLTVDELPSFATLDAYCAAFKARPAEPCDAMYTDCKRTPSPAKCGPELLDADPPPVPAGVHARWFGTESATRDVRRCNLAFDVGGKVFVLEDLGNAPCGAPTNWRMNQPGDVRFELALQGPWLVVMTSELSSPMEVLTDSSLTEYLRVCAVDASSVGCTAKQTIGELEQHADTGDGPGADGLSLDIVVKWQIAYKLVGSSLVLSRLRGKLDPDVARDVVGKHRLIR